jgi:bacterioferritin-associated ferredoxin
MYVCVCRAVTERQVEQAIQAGAQNLRDLRRELGVTSECGRCASCARQCLQRVEKQQSSQWSHPLLLAANPC